ncbi:MAG TPA: hypothetical protein VHG30_02515 [Microvirga sp.]|jgi:ribose/xylose/arabinose/galactoside ABC-type transport system permease subunit|nr:hypothetical protein [Microvirga sp.]
MRYARLATLFGFVLLTISSALAQTSAPGGTAPPGTTPAANTEGASNWWLVANWWLIILVLVAVAAAIWYRRTRRGGRV